MPNDDLLTEFATENAYDAAKNEGKQFSIILILTIITTLIQIYRFCKDFKVSSANNPSIFQRLLLKRFIRKAIKENPEAKEYFNGIYAALLGTGKGMTEEKLGLLKKSLEKKIAELGDSL